MFPPKRSIFGMIHLLPLPGTPALSRRGRSSSMKEIVQRAVDEAKLLLGAGFDGLILENMHDVPYLRRNVGPEIVSAMTVAAQAVRECSPDTSMGIQILAGANREALAVAKACDLQFIRAEGFVFASVADEGLLDEADAGPLLRYRKMIEAESIHILADIKKKHSSHAITSDVDLLETAKAATFFGADGIILTGSATGQPTPLDDVQRVRAELPDSPLFIGSGVTPETAPQLLEYADALIVGSYLKKDGLWSNEMDPQRAAEIAKSHD